MVDHHGEAHQDHEAKTARTFDSGATRDTLVGKIAFSRFLSPRVLRRYCEYLHEHRTMRDGSIREPDNWKKGLPGRVFIDSNLRHVWDVWEFIIERKDLTIKEYEDALCGIIFNSMGLLFESLTEAGEIKRPGEKG